jgi:hypothetical protein
MAQALNTARRWAARLGGAVGGRYERLGVTAAVGAVGGGGGGERARRHGALTRLATAALVLAVVALAVGSLARAVHAAGDYLSAGLHGAALALRNESDFAFDFGAGADGGYQAGDLDEDAASAAGGGDGDGSDAGEGGGDGAAGGGGGADGGNATAGAPDVGDDDDQDGYDSGGGSGSDGDGGGATGADGKPATASAAASRRPLPPQPQPPGRSRSPTATRWRRWWPPRAGGSPLPTRSRLATRSPSSSARPSRAPGSSSAASAPACGAEDAPTCRHWTWGCDAAAVNADASAATWWEDTGRGGLHRLFWKPPGCNTDDLSWANVSQCLKGKHILLLGDSITRYQYYNLINFLDGGEWHPRVSPAAEHARGWRNGFNGLYAGVARRLGGREICDCGRRPGLALENHFYYNPALGVRVSFLWRPGTDGMHFHALQWVGERCQYNAFRQRRRALNEARWDDHASGSHCAQKGCSPGGCQRVGGSQFYTLDDLTGVRYFVHKLQPDALVMNVGLWTGAINRPDRVEKLVELGRALRWEFPRLRLVWKTTTWRDPSAGMTEHTVPRELLSRAGWAIVDAAGATRGIRELAARHGPGGFYRDPIHFQPFVYRALNELLLGDLCSARTQWP